MLHSNPHSICDDHSRRTRQAILSSFPRVSFAKNKQKNRTVLSKWGSHNDFLCWKPAIRAQWPLLWQNSSHLTSCQVILRSVFFSSNSQGWRASTVRSGVDLAQNPLYTLSTFISISLGLGHMILATSKSNWRITNRWFDYCIFCFLSCNVCVVTNE